MCVSYVLCICLVYSYDPSSVANSKQPHHGLAESILGRPPPQKKFKMTLNPMP